MNLNSKSGVSRLPLLFAVLLIAVITGLSAVFHQMAGQQPAVAERPLGVDEQQVILGAVDRVERRRPELSASATKFDLFLNDHGVEVFTPSQGMISLGNKQVRFNTAFFEADTVAQEKAIEPLLDKGSPFNVPSSPKSLAVRPR